LRDNSGDGFFLNVEESGNAFNVLLLSTQSAAGRPIVTLGSTINKGIFGASVLVRLAGRILFVTILAMLGVQLWHAAAGDSVSMGTALSAVIQNWLYQVLVAGALLLNMRHIIVRLTEPEVGR